MYDWLTSYLEACSRGYFIDQLGVILFIFLLGLLITGQLICGNKETDSLSRNVRLSVCLAFPVGIAVLIVTGYIVLITGMPYRASVIGLIMCIVLVIAGILYVKGGQIYKNIKITHVIIGCVVVCSLAVVAVSGRISISVSNDSLYYFWQYPRAICYFEGLRDQFDNFMTDTGLGAAIIGTLPFLFGFGETFGIQEFFHMSFILFFTNAVYEVATEDLEVKNNKNACVIATLAGVIFASCTPVYIISHWAMANMYFMEFYFMCMYTLFRLKLTNNRQVILLSIMLFACSSVRMEGVILILMLVVMMSVRDINSKRLALSLVLTAVLSSGYIAKIFIAYVIDNPFIFMTPLKAGLQFVAVLGVAAYLCVVKNKIPHAIKRVVPFAFIAVLLLVNIALMFINRGVYVANLYAMYGNLTGQSGWGVLPYLSIGAVFIILIWELVVNRKSGRLVEIISPDKNVTSFFLFNLIGFYLSALAVSFARGDAMSVSTGDSGNRVLLQITPIVLMTFVTWIIELLNRETIDKD